MVFNKKIYRIIHTMEDWRDQKIMLVGYFTEVYTFSLCRKPDHRRDMCKQNIVDHNCTQIKVFVVNFYNVVSIFHACFAKYKQHLADE